MPKLLLVGLEPNETPPDLTLYATDAALRPIAVARKDERGGLTLPEEALAKASYVAIAAAGEKVEKLSRDSAILYRPEQYRGLVKQSDVLEIARPRWEVLIPIFRRCVTGHVRRCHWWPIVALAQEVSIAALAKPVAAAPALRASLAQSSAISAAISAADVVRQPLRPFPPFRCAPVCEGLVEVYQRVCCWYPIVILDPRIDEIIRRLKELVAIEKLPRFPPVPNPPDPAPFETLRLFKGGALDEAAECAARPGCAAVAAGRAAGRLHRGATLSPPPRLLRHGEQGGAGLLAARRQLPGLLARLPDHPAPELPCRGGVRGEAGDQRRDGDDL